jgi:hypothetical protein
MFNVLVWKMALSNKWTQKTEMYSCDCIKMLVYKAKTIYKL